MTTEKNDNHVYIRVGADEYVHGTIIAENKAQKDHFWWSWLQVRVWALYV